MRKPSRQENHPYQSLIQKEISALPSSHHWDDFFNQVHNELNYFFQSFRGATSPADVIRSVKQIVRALEDKHRWAKETSINNPKARDFLRLWFSSLESIGNKENNVSQLDKTMREKLEPLLNQDTLYAYVSEVVGQGQVVDRQTWLNLSAVLAALYYGENPMGQSASEAITMRFNHYRANKLGPAMAANKVSLELNTKLRAFRDGLPPKRRTLR